MPHLSKRAFFVFVANIWQKSTAPVAGGGWAQRQVASDSVRGHWYVGQGGWDAGPSVAALFNQRHPTKNRGKNMLKFEFSGNINVVLCCFTSVGPGDTKAQFWMILWCYVYKADNPQAQEPHILKLRRIPWNFQRPCMFLLVCYFKKVDAMWRGLRSWTCSPCIGRLYGKASTFF